VRRRNGSEPILVPQGTEPIRLDDPDLEEKALIQSVLYGQNWFVIPRKD
jgi:hypothetical protein